MLEEVGIRLLFSFLYGVNLFCFFWGVVFGWVGVCGVIGRRN